MLVVRIKMAGHHTHLSDLEASLVALLAGLHLARPSAPGIQPAAGQAWLASPLVSLAVARPGVVQWYQYILRVFCPPLMLWPQAPCPHSKVPIPCCGHGLPPRIPGTPPILQPSGFRGPLPYCGPSLPPRIPGTPPMLRPQPPCARSWDPSDVASPGAMRAS